MAYLFNKRSVPNKPNSRTPGEIDRDTAARYTRRFYRDVLTSLEQAHHVLRAEIRADMKELQTTIREVLQQNG